MASGGSVIPQSQTVNTGASWGAVPSYSNGTALTCNVQEMSVKEALQYGAQGQARWYNVFFASDPSLEVGKRLKVTKMNNATLATPRFLKVMATEFEGNPGGDLQLWIAVCEEVTTRMEA